jgi:hypothetical protein
VPASLIVGTYDLLDYSSPVRLTDTTSFGAGVPDLTTVARVLLDGDAVSGRRTGNRQITLSVLIAGGSIAANATIAANLGQVVDQQSWTMPWTPADGEPTVAFDCYRGNLTRDWSLPSMPGDPAWMVTLTFAAEPFTRSTVPIVLGASAQAGGVTINGFETTTGTGGGPAHTAYTKDSTSVGEDVPGAGLQLDSTTSVVGTKSLRITQALGIERTSQNALQAGAQLATTVTLATPTDFTAQQFIVFSAKTNATVNTQSVKYAGAPPPADQQDATGVWTQGDYSTPANVHPQNRAFYVTLTDATGKRSTWVHGQDLLTSWLRVYINISVAATAADAGFDRTKVASVRVRYYVSTDTPENAGYLPNVDSPELITSSSTPVTVGLPYSAAATTINQPAGAPFHTSQLGLEWVNASSGIITTTWGPVATSVREQLQNPDGSSIDQNAATPVVTDTAPAGAVSVNIRSRPGPGSVTSGLSYTHLNQSSAPERFRYPSYGGYDAATLWLDDLNAVPQGSGMVLTGPYATQVFAGVQGAARTPISLTVNAAGTGAKRFLLARTPNPSPTFSPFLTSPTTSPTAITSSSALSGHYYGVPVTTVATSTALTYTVPATGYSGSYSVLARVFRNNSGSPVSSIPTATAWLTSDVATTSTTSRIFAFTGRDATIFPSDTTFSIVSLGVITLPPKAVGGANTGDTITISITDATTDASPSGLGLDMLILVSQAGDMIFVNMPAAKNWLFVDPPSPSMPYGSVLAGNLPDRTDATSATGYTYGNPVLNFSPGVNQVTALLDQSTTGGNVAVSYYPRWQGEQPHDTTATTMTGGYPATYPSTY